jgi:hypothetical protein
MGARNEIAVLERMMRAGIADIPPEAARYFLSLDFSDADQDRLDELSQHAREGSLTSAEREELDDLIRLADFLAILQSKSRQSLKNLDAPAA